MGPAVASPGSAAGPKMRGHLELGSCLGGGARSLLAQADLSSTPARRPVRPAQPLPLLDPWHRHAARSVPEPAHLYGPVWSQNIPTGHAVTPTALLPEGTDGLETSSSSNHDTQDSPDWG